MSVVEIVVLLLICASVGCWLGCKFGYWFAIRETGSESYKELKRHRDTLAALMQTALESAEAQYVHHRCERKPANVESKQEDSFDDWIPG